MKTLFRFSLLAAGLAAASLVHADPAAPACKPHDGHGSHHAKLGLVVHELKLTDDQRAKAKTVFTQTSAAVKEIKANAALTDEQKHVQITTLRTSAREQLRALLTPYQQGQMAEIMSHPAVLKDLERRHERRAALMRRLDLTAEQRTKMHAIHEQTVAAVKPILADTSLMPEQREAKVREIREAGRAQMHGVLTPEQQQKLDKIRHHLTEALGPLS